MTNKHFHGEAFTTENGPCCGPVPYSKISQREADLVSALFWEEVNEYRAYWNLFPTKELLRWYWQGARMDARAQMQDES
jgi:hypothetical protein